MSRDRAPLLVGVAQCTHREPDPRRAPGPVEALAGIAREAAEDAGGGRALLEACGAIGLVDTLGWRPRNGPRLVADALGIAPRRQLQIATGGESPLTLVNRLSRDIAAGKLAAALVVATNHLRSFARARREGVRLDWQRGGEGEPERIGEERPGHSEREGAVGLAEPKVFYPFFENAHRAARGEAIPAQRERLGRLFAPFSQVAARNPHAWFPRARSAAEIATPTAENRMIAFPYTKYMNAVIETDQSAAVILASPELARELGLGGDRAVRWWGGAEARDPIWNTSERPLLAGSAVQRTALLGALCDAGVGVADLGAFDLYSCFPIAVELACEVLGLAADDPRGLTVTGGLPYAGGPGNGYTLHALASLVERLRAEGGRPGLVTGLGWYLTKHSATVLGVGERPQTPSSATPAVPAIPAREPVEIADAPEGTGRIESYTVVHDREGAPARGIVVGRLGDERRFLANTPDDRALLEALETAEAVGRAGRVGFADGCARFDPR